MYSDGAVCTVCTLMVLYVLYVLLEAGSVAKFLVHGVTLLSVIDAAIRVSNPTLCCAVCVCVCVCVCMQEQRSTLNSH